MPEIFNEQRMIKLDLKKDTLNPKLKAKLESKYNDLRTEADRRRTNEDQEIIEFIGTFSYDIRVKKGLN